MKVPPMMPSAVERRNTAREVALKKWDSENHDRRWPLVVDPYIANEDIEAIESAYRDGYAAGFAAALGMLREPSEELITECAWAIYDDRQLYLSQAERVLRAAASALADIAEKDDEDAARR